MKFIRAVRSDINITNEASDPSFLFSGTYWTWSNFFPGFIPLIYLPTPTNCFLVLCDIYRYINPFLQPELVCYMYLYVTSKYIFLRLLPLNVLPLNEFTASYIFGKSFLFSSPLITPLLYPCPLRILIKTYIWNNSPYASLQ